MIINLLILVAVVAVAAVLGRAIWPTHLSTLLPPVAGAPLPKVPQHSDRNTGRWLRECELILAAGSGRHRAARRVVWAR